jgi:hypothetical protein
LKGEKMRFFTISLTLLLLSVGCGGDSPTQPTIYEDNFTFLSVTPSPGTSLQVSDEISLTYSISYEDQYSGEKKSYAILLRRRDNSVYILKAWGGTGGWQEENKTDHFIVTNDLVSFLRVSPAIDLKYVIVREYCCVYLEGMTLSSYFWDRVLQQWSYDVNYPTKRSALI